MSNKKRALDCSIRKSQTFAQLSFRQRDLWHGLITVADDQGRMPGLPAFVRSQVWPYQDINLQDVATDLATLEDMENIATYTVNGQVFIQIVNWWKYQSMQWAGKSDYPAPPGWTDRARYHTKDNKVATENWDTEGGYLHGVPTNVPTLEPSRDVNVNGKGNGNGEGDAEDEAQEEPQPFDLLLTQFLDSTGIPENMVATGSNVDTVREWVKAGYTPDEVKAAIEQMQEKQLTIVRPASINNALAIVRSKSKNGRSKAKDYISGQFAEYIEH